MLLLSLIYPRSAEAGTAHVHGDDFFHSFFHRIAPALREEILS
jgi:hypothetical protein